MSPASSSFRHSSLSPSHLRRTNPVMLITRTHARTPPEDTAVSCGLMTFPPPRQHHHPLPHDYVGSGSVAVHGRCGHALLPIHLRVRLLQLTQEQPVARPLFHFRSLLLLVVVVVVANQASSTPSLTTSPRTRPCCWWPWPTPSSSTGPLQQVSGSSSFKKKNNHEQTKKTTTQVLLAFSRMNSIFVDIWHHAC